MSNYDSTARKGKNLPRGVYIAICIFPLISTILFYSLRTNRLAMDWINGRIMAPLRRVLGLFSSIYPFSLMEVLGVIGVSWIFYYIVKTIIVTARRRGKLRILGQRLLTVAVVLLYAWSSFCWLWNSGYYSYSFAEKSGFTGSTVNSENLLAVANYFAEKANELAQVVPRDEKGAITWDRQDLLAASLGIYDQVFQQYPDLETRLFKPKPMMFSWLMSRTGYLGIYFAPTGESNINTRAPIFLMPATIAHELAHQCGIAQEDEANFIGILACVTSGNLAYEYAGYLSGLIYLRNALSATGVAAWLQFSNSLSSQVRRDLDANSEYWRRQKTVETGVAVIDNALTAVTTVVSDAVNTAYDGFLKSQDQELGLMSYGACVDLLVEYFMK